MGWPASWADHPIVPRPRGRSGLARTHPWAQALPVVSRGPGSPTGSGTSSPRLARIAPLTWQYTLAPKATTQRMMAIGMPISVMKKIQPTMVVAQISRLKLNAPAADCRTNWLLSLYRAQTMSGPRMESHPAESTAATRVETWPRTAQVRSSSDTAIGLRVGSGW